MGGGAKGSKNSGPTPKQLPEIDWLDTYHRMVVISSLIEGVYLLQRDKQKKVNSQPSLWWESFGFSLVKLLINEDDGSIYGAVFENNNYHTKSHSAMSPRFVFAFRGTLLKSKTWLSDVEEGIQCFFNNLNKGSRFQQAIHEIETILEKHATEKTSVWLAGHSLGAGIALMAGKTMAKQGVTLKTYAFSPPILSFPLETLSDITVFKHLFRFGESLFKGTVAVVAHLQTQAHDPRIAAWTPYLYVNPSDPFCKESIGILKYKKIMAYIGLDKFESLCSSISLRRLAFGIESGDPVQILSSADMFVNMNKSDVETSNLLKKPWYKLKMAHGLEQWWDPTVRENWKSYNLRPSKPCTD